MSHTFHIHLSATSTPREPAQTQKGLWLGVGWERGTGTPLSLPWRHSPCPLSYFSAFQCAGFVSVNMRVCVCPVCRSACPCTCVSVSQLSVPLYHGDVSEGPAQPTAAVPGTCEALGVDDDPLHWVEAAPFFILLQAQGDLLGCVLERTRGAVGRGWSSATGWGRREGKG